MLALDAIIGYVVIAVCVVLYLRFYAGYPMVPHRASLDAGWWNWTDQGRYYREARAWAHADLRPSEHWYLPLYSLVGAAFLPVGPAEPFWLPDAICLALSGVLVSCLAPRIMPGLPLARLWGAVAFYAGEIWQPFALKSWVEPWTTTPTAPLMFGLLLACLRLRDRPGAARAALCGALWGLVLMTRPTEAVWSALPAILFCAVTVALAPQTLARRLRIALGGLLAASALIALTVWLHWIVWGWSWGDYFLQSLGTGFELRLLPLRWNWLVLDSAPAHEAYDGLAMVFPWVLPGFAGIAACMLAPRGRRATHLLIGGSVVVHWLVYLCYRDLHPEGLWRFSNYHYFKWTQALLCLYAIALCLRLAQRSELLRATAAVVFVLLCCCWHVRMKDISSKDRLVTIVGPHELLVHGGLTRPDQAVLVAAHGGDDAIYSGPHGIDQAGRSWGYNGDLKAWPLPGGLALSTLRRMPRGDAIIHLDPGVSVDAGTHPRLVRMKLVFGLPCAVLRHRAVCRPGV